MMTLLERAEELYATLKLEAKHKDQVKRDFEAAAECMRRASLVRDLIREVRRKEAA